MRSTTISNPQPREQLAALLVDRHVAAMGVVEEIEDEDLGKAIDTVAAWDAEPGVGPGLLVKWLRAGDWRTPSESAPELSFWQSGWHDLCDELRAEGFEERLVSFAASAVMIRPGVPRTGLRAHLEAAYPWLFGEESEAA